MSNKPKSILPPRLPGQPIKDTSKSIPVINKPMNRELKTKLPDKVVKTEKIGSATPKVIAVGKSHKTAVILCIVFAVIVALSAFVYWIAPKPIYPADIFINFDASYQLEFSYEAAPGQTSKLLPGDSFNAVFTVSSSDELGSSDEVFVRIRLYAEMDNNYYGDIFEYTLINSNWQTGADGYIYYKNTLSANTSAEVFSKITLKMSLDNRFNGKHVSVYFVAEALQADRQAIEEYWITAPYEWKILFDRGWEE